MVQSYELLCDVVDNGYILTINDIKADQMAVHTGIYPSPVELGHGVERFFDNHRPSGVRSSGMPNTVLPAGVIVPFVPNPYRDGTAGAGSDPYTGTTTAEPRWINGG